MAESLTKQDIASLLDEHTETILRVVKEGFDGTATREELADVKTDLAGVKTDLAGVKTDLADVKQRLTRVEATMVTKSYLDDKLADLKGDLIMKLRKEDAKLDFVIAILQNRSILSEEDTRRIRTEFSIFPTPA